MDRIASLVDKELVGHPAAIQNFATAWLKVYDKCKELGMPNYNPPGTFGGGLAHVLKFIEEMKSELDNCTRNLDEHWQEIQTLRNAIKRANEEIS